MHEGWLNLASALQDWAPILFWLVWPVRQAFWFLGDLDRRRDLKIQAQTEHDQVKIATQTRPVPSWAHRTATQGE